MSWVPWLKLRAGSQESWVFFGQMTQAAGFPSLGLDFSISGMGIKALPAALLGLVGKKKQEPHPGAHSAFRNVLPPVRSSSPGAEKRALDWKQGSPLPSPEEPQFPLPHKRMTGPPHRTSGR